MLKIFPRVTFSDLSKVCYIMNIATSPVRQSLHTIQLLSGNCTKKKSSFYLQ